MARDRIHNAVVQALKNDGWTILAQQERIRYNHRLFEFDIHATKADSVRTIEVKSFWYAFHDTVALYEALGQYIIYRTVLAEVYPERDLYLAVSTTVFDRVFAAPLVQRIIAEQAMKLLVVKVLDMQYGEVAQWLP